MAHFVCVLVLLLGMAVRTASAQDLGPRESLRGGVEDARTVLQAAVTATGAANLTSIQYSGSGWIAATGQSFSLSEDWPRWEVPSYSRVIDYNGRAYREEYVRRQGNFPPRGGGGTPLAGEQRMISLLTGTFAWNMNGDMPVPQPGQYMAGIPVSELRQLEIFLTPHGFLKGAMAANDAQLTSVTLPFAGPTNAGMTGNGRTATILSPGWIRSSGTARIASRNAARASRTR